MPPYRPIAEVSQEFYNAVGMAITEWANIDAELFHVCAAILKTAQHHVAIIYYRTPTLDTRLTLTDDLARSLFPKLKSGEHATAPEKAWSALRTDIKGELPIRNQLAHSPAAPNVEFGERNKAGYPVSITDVWFASFTSATEKLRGRTEKELRLGDVKSHIVKVGAFINRLRNFREHELPKLLE
jgi:hypothetical protein